MIFIDKMAIIVEPERSKLYRRIKALLGAPVRGVELEDEQMDSLLELSIGDYEQYILDWLIPFLQFDLSNFPSLFCPMYFPCLLVLSVCIASWLMSLSASNPVSLASFSCSQSHWLNPLPLALVASLLEPSVSIANRISFPLFC